MKRLKVLLLAIPLATLSSAQTYHFTNLGTLSRATSRALCVNIHGEVVGSADTASGQSRAFTYPNGVTNDLGSFGGPESYRLGINDLGQVVGGSPRATVFKIRFHTALSIAKEILSRIGGKTWKASWIVVDERTNSLLVSTGQPFNRKVAGLVKQLDARDRLMAPNAKPGKWQCD